MPTLHELEWERRKREKRRKLEGSFKSFIEWVFPLVHGVDFIFEEHHHRIIQALEDVTLLIILRLVINIPPGYGKTETVVVLWTAWCFAKYPKCKNLHLSYSSDLAEINSVSVLDIINLDEFQELWPTKMDEKTSGKRHWKATKGKGESVEFRAASTGGMVTGFRAGYLSKGFNGAVIIDDPIKPEDAQSDVKRNKINARMNSTVKNRLARSDVPVVMIMQRIHDNDPAGFCLDGKTGDDYELLNIPAILDAGTENERALWPAKDPLEWLKNYQKTAPYVFSSQYMGNPVPDEGVFFKRDWFNWYEPDDHTDEDYVDIQNIQGEHFGASDNATTKDAGDFTEQGVFKVTPDSKVYIRDWWAGQETSDVWIENQLDLCKRYDIKRWAGETGPIKNATEPFLKRRMVERNIYVVLEWFSHAEASKEQNARGFQAIASQGRVWLPKRTWAYELVEQLCRFPMGTRDDGVDTCSLLAKMLNKMWSIEQIPPKESQPTGLTLNELVAANRRANKNKRRRL